MKSLHKAIFLLPVTALFIAASANQKPEKIDTSKWSSFASKAGDYKIKAPEGWAIGDPNDPAYKEGIEKVRKENPKLLPAASANLDQNELMLIDFSNIGGVGISNFILKTMKDTGLTTKMYPDVAKAVISQAKLQKSGWKLVDLPAGKSVNYWGITTIQLGEGKSIDIFTNGYMTIKSNRTYISTFTTTGDMEKAQRPNFEAMAQSIILK